MQEDRCLNWGRTTGKGQGKRCGGAGQWEAERGDLLVSGLENGKETKKEEHDVWNSRCLHALNVTQ